MMMNSTNYSNFCITQSHVDMQILGHSLCMLLLAVYHMGYIQNKILSKAQFSLQLHPAKYIISISHGRDFDLSTRNPIQYTSSFIYKRSKKHDHKPNIISILRSMLWIYPIWTHCIQGRKINLSSLSQLSCYKKSCDLAIVVIQLSRKITGVMTSAD